MEKIKKPAPVILLEAFTGELNADDHKEEQEDKIQALADSCLINLSESLEPPPVAMQIISDGKPITLFTKGNFSIITGAAKSRKSFLISMFMAAAIKGSFQDQFLCNETGNNIIFDTEQAKYKVQQIAKRICNLSENVNPSNLLVYSLRTQEPSERIDIIDHVLSTTQNINFVAIDGIIDLDIDPILQAEQAQRIIHKLMQWTEIYNIHITCVLHYNKTVSTLLGHLGSFSHRKADAVIEVSKSKENKNVSIVKAVDCREKEFEPFAFSVDPSAMPYVLEDYVIENKGKEKKAPKEKTPAFTPDQLSKEDHKEILNSCFKNDVTQINKTCLGNIQNATQAVTGISIGRNKAIDFLSRYVFDGDIIKVEQKPYPVYTLAGQKTIEFSHQFNELPVSV